MVEVGVQQRLLLEYDDLSQKHDLGLHQVARLSSEKIDYINLITSRDHDNITSGKAFRKVEDEGCFLLTLLKICTVPGESRKVF